MLQPWDIYRWNQHSLIKDLTKYEPNLRTRNFGGGGGALPLISTVLPWLLQCYHSGHGPGPSCLACLASLACALTVWIVLGATSPSLRLHELARECCAASIGIAWFMLHGWGANAPHSPHLRLRPGGLRPPGPPHWRIRARVKGIWYIGITELVRGQTGTGP